MSMYGLHFGFYVAIFNPLSDPIFKGVYGLKDAEIKGLIGNVNMFFGIGSFFSILISGSLAEKIGRRKLLIIYDVGALISACLYLVKDLRVLQLARFLSGFFANGQGIISSILVTETLPKKISGLANSILFGVSTGCLFIAYIQPYIFTREQIIEHWRPILCWPIVFFVIKIALFLIFVTKDSPKFYIKTNFKGSTKESLISNLNEIYSQTHRESQIDDIT